MDADLCRRAAAIKDTPLWSHTFDGDREKKDAFIKDLTQYKTFEDLDDETQQFFLDCERSEAIATEMGHLPGLYLDEDELTTIMEKLHAS